MPGLEVETTGVAAVAGFTSLLSELLNEASAVKQTSTVEPAISKPDFANLQQRLSTALTVLGGSIRDNAVYQNAITKAAEAKEAAETAEETGQESDKAHASSLQAEADVLRVEGDSLKLRQFAVIETATRELFDDLIATIPIDSPDFVKMWNLLDIVSILSDDEQCEPALLFWLVEELLDSQTINGCRTIFDYLESRRESITAQKFEQKKLVILRSCNELLRRLSRAEDTAFCGRVFIFMFQCFPLGDRSSVNLRGEYHVENVTTYEVEDPAATQMDVDSQPDGQKEAGETKAGSKGVSFDNKDPEKPLDPETLYPKFWSLQEYFSQPTKLLQTPAFNEFKSNLSATVKTFEAIPNDEEPRTARSVEDAGKNLKRKRGSQGHEAPETFAPKYLTSKDLFELEMSDLSFRRHTLVQALIILDFLLTFTRSGKEKLATVQTSNRAMINSIELKEDDAKWTNDMKERIVDYLRRGLDGPFFYRTVETVLARDKNWVIWKMESCPPIQRPSVTPTLFTEAKTAAQRMATHKRLRPVPMGAVSLDFLRDEDQEAAMEKLKAEERFRLPDLDDFKSKIADDDFEIGMPTNDQTKAAAIAGKSSKSWRALRIAGRSKLAAFDKIDDPQNVGIVFEELPDVDEVEEDVEPAAAEEDMPSNRDAIIVSGDEGADVSPVVEKVMELYKGVFAQVVRHTTREPVDEEVNGKTFHFVKAQEFNQLRDGDRLVEYGTRDDVDYGTSTKAIEAITELGKVPVMILDKEAAQFAKDMGFSARYILIKSAGETDEPTVPFDKVISFGEADIDVPAKSMGDYIFDNSKDKDDSTMQEAEPEVEAPAPIAEGEGGDEEGDAQGGEADMTDAPATGEAAAEVSAE